MFRKLDLLFQVFIPMIALLILITFLKLFIDRKIIYINIRNEEGHIWELNNIKGNKLYYFMTSAVLFNELLLNILNIILQHLLFLSLFTIFTLLMCTCVCVYMS